MARRNSKQNDAPVETTDESTPAEAPAEGTATATEAPAEVDLTGFKQAVENAVSESDTSTGEVPEASLAAVTAEYRKLEGIKAKNQAKAFVNEGMKNAMDSDSLAGARAYLNIQETALVAAAGGSKAERTPTDPTEAFVQRVAVLQLAYHLVTQSVPEGVTEDWQDKVGTLVSESAGQATAYQAWLVDESDDKGDEPDTSAVVKNAVKLAEGKTARAGVARSGGGSFDGPRRDTARHIINAFADKEDGTFLKIAEIRNVHSEEYGTELPSAGAISARLFPKSGKSVMPKHGIHPTERDGKKGAVKGEPVEDTE
jgi:hypothetical protein